MAKSVDAKEALTLEQWRALYAAANEFWRAHMDVERIAAAGCGQSRCCLAASLRKIAGGRYSRRRLHRRDEFAGPIEPFSSPPAYSDRLSGTYCRHIHRRRLR